MPPKIIRRYSMAKRYKKIIDVLIKYQFDFIVDELKLRPYPVFSSKRASQVQSHRSVKTFPQRMRMVLEELGPTYVKLGQILSVRKDLIPSAYAEEFSKLQDTVPPFPYEDVESLILKELGASVDDLFVTFEHIPVAAASIGQVHLAKLKDGTEVVVKVQRPGIGHLIETDIDIMYSLARMAEEHMEEARSYRLISIVDDFARSIRDETDYTQEVHNISVFSRNFKDVESVYIPEVYWDYSSRKVLTLEYLKGIRGNDYGQLDALHHDRRQIAMYGANAFMKQIFEDGLFHADIHPGNVFILENGTIALIDFGMVGHLSRDLRNGLIDALFALTKGDVARCIEIMYDFNIIDTDTDVQKLSSDIEYFLDRYYGRPLEQLDTSAMIGDIFSILRIHRARVPPGVTLLLRGTLMITGFGLQLEPGFNIAEVFETHAKKYMKQRFSPGNIADSVFKDVSRYSRSFHKMPLQVSHILSIAEKGELNVRIEHDGMNPVVAGIDTASNRIAFSFVISSVIVGSSLIIQSDMPPLIWGVPALGLLGFTLALLLGMWLVFYILRNGRI